MYFERGEVSDPDEGWKIVDEDVANVRAGSFTARHGNSLHPRGRERWCVLFVEGFTEDTVRKTLERDGVILQVGEYVFGDVDVVIDYVCLGKLRAGVQKFIEVREWNAPAPNT